MSHSIGKIPSHLYRHSNPHHVLWAFYDLSVSPATFDIVPFLGLAELHRQNTECNGMHVVIVPGPKDGFRDDNFTPYDTENKRWRLNNILVPCCWLVPSCRQATLLAAREEARLLEAAMAKHVFPKGYSVESPKENYRLSHMVEASDIPTIRASTMARRIVCDWIKTNADNRRVVTINLRESSYEQDRNSSLSDWVAFVHHLDQELYCPVIIRDAEAVYTELPSEFRDFVVFSDVIWNIELRTALYELSYLNLFVNNGPAALSRLNRYSRSLTFKMITPTAYATREKYFHASGLKPGTQLSSVSPYHRLVWADDTEETIQKEFSTMCQMIDRSPSAAGLEPIVSE